MATSPAHVVKKRANTSTKRRYIVEFGKNGTGGSMPCVGLRQLSKLIDVFASQGNSVVVRVDDVPLAVKGGESK